MIQDLIKNDGNISIESATDTITRLLLTINMVILLSYLKIIILSNIILTFFYHLLLGLAAKFVYIKIAVGGLYSKFMGVLCAGFIRAVIELIVGASLGWNN